MRFKTDFNGYAVKFSPFEDGRIAVATSQNFGIIGNGRQYILQVTHATLQNCESSMQANIQVAAESVWLSAIGHTARATANCSF